MAGLDHSSMSAFLTLHPKLKSIVSELLPMMNVKIVYGIRGKALQDELYKAGKSKTPFPTSKHNRTHDPSIPENLVFTISDAVDIVPINTLYSDINYLCYMQGMIKAIAIKQSIKIRQGVLWEHPNIQHNISHGFFDAAHVELVW